MNPDPYTLAIFSAGVLLGIALTIMAIVAGDTVRAVRSWPAALRHRRRPPGEPRPLDHRRS